MYFIYIPVSHFSSGFYHMTFRHLCLRQEVRPQNFSSLCSLVYLSCGYRNHPSHCCARNLHSLLAHCFGLSARFANRPRFDSCCNARRYAAGSVTRALASLEKLANLHQTLTLLTQARLQIFSRRRSKSSQPTPRGFAC